VAQPQEVSFESVVAELASDDEAVRLRAVRMLKEAAYPEAAVPLAARIADARDDIQFEAIAAELNIFLAQPVVPRERVALVIERRTRIAADDIFDRGPLMLGPQEVPVQVLHALRAAARDDNPRVRVEAVYAFGVLAVEAGGRRRAEMLAESGPDLAAMIGAVDPVHRYAAVRVLGRVFARRPSDPPIEPSVGDAIISVLNDRDDSMRRAAMQALGAMKYERAVSGLMDLFQYYEKGEMAEATLDAIGHVGHPLSTALLSMQLSADSDRLAISAIEGLARTGDAARFTEIQTVPGLERNEGLQLASSFAAGVLADGPLDRLVEALANPRTRGQALAYLVEIAPGRTGRFERFLQSPDAVVRAALVDILGLSGDPDALPLVDGMSGDADPQVAQAAARATSRLHQVAQ
jgi:HEAT repeat protein